MHRATAATAATVPTAFSQARTTTAADATAPTAIAAPGPLCDGHVLFIESVPRSWALWPSGWTLL